ncbi:hypothetical protein [Collimonas silvisoli]|uniref:hypothetical protein n=1 Tax=Collimonas silvisoli TaxID=2825884 RepID=UPI001B8B25BA|nr:hypothetical protein [Collimonas silvisoli]
MRGLRIAAIVSFEQWDNGGGRDDKSSGQTKKPIAMMGFVGKILKPLENSLHEIQ